LSEPIAIIGATGALDFGMAINARHKAHAGIKITGV
jgi:hypothetical protein